MIYWSGSCMNETEIERHRNNSKIEYRAVKHEPNCFFLIIFFFFFFFRLSHSSHTTIRSTMRFLISTNVVNEINAGVVLSVCCFGIFDFIEFRGRGKRRKSGKNHAPNEKRNQNQLIVRMQKPSHTYVSTAFVPHSHFLLVEIYIVSSSSTSYSKYVWVCQCVLFCVQLIHQKIQMKTKKKKRVKRCAEWSTRGRLQTHKHADWMLCMCQMSRHPYAHK